MLTMLRQVIPAGYTVSRAIWIMVAGLAIGTIGWYFGCNATLAIGAVILILA